MRTLKTILATAITWAAISGLVYAVIRYFDTAMYFMAGVGAALIIISTIYHWWEKFED